MLPLPNSSVDAFLNSFAIRSFRDVADHDYIAARMAYRGQLIQQFHWSSLQAVEKYLKCILMLNRVKAKNLRHDLGKALELIETHLFQLRLTNEARDFIKHLDRFGQFRYLEISYYVRGFELVELDRTIWQLRRYCRPLNADLIGSDGKPRRIKHLIMDSIERAESLPPQRFRIHNGTIERILDDRDHPARAALVWKNVFFGRSLRNSIRMRRHGHSTNAPLALHPEMLDEVLKYVHVPSRVADAFRAAANAKKGKNPP
jgi:hypothetical protein